MKGITLNRKFYAKIVLLFTFGAFNAIMFQNCSNWKGNVLVDAKNNKLIDANGDVIDNPLNQSEPSPQISVGEVIVLEQHTVIENNTTAFQTPANSDTSTNSGTADSSSQVTPTNSNPSTDTILTDGSDTLNSTPTSITTPSSPNLPTTPNSPPGNSETSNTNESQVDNNSTPNPPPAITAVNQIPPDSTVANDILNDTDSDNSESNALKLCGPHLAALKLIGHDVSIGNDNEEDDDDDDKSCKEDSKFDLNNLLKQERVVFKLKKEGLKLKTKGLTVLINDSDKKMVIEKIKFHGILIACGNIQIKKLKAESHISHFISINSDVNKGRAKSVAVFSKTSSSTGIQFTKLDGKLSFKPFEFSILNDKLTILKDNHDNNHNNKHHNNHDHNDDDDEHDGKKENGKVLNLVSDLISANKNKNNKNK